MRTSNCCANIVRGRFGWSADWRFALEGKSERRTRHRLLHRPSAILRAAQVRADVRVAGWRSVGLNWCLGEAFEKIFIGPVDSSFKLDLGPPAEGEEAGAIHQLAR